MISALSLIKKRTGEYGDAEVADYRRRTFVVDDNSDEDDGSYDGWSCVIISTKKKIEGLAPVWQRPTAFVPRLAADCDAPDSVHYPHQASDR